MNNLSTNKEIIKVNNSPLENEILQNLINITPADSSDLSNIVINNTLKVDYTSSVLDQNNLSGTNSNSGIGLKDRNDGHFKKIYLNDNDLYIVPQDYINNVPQPAGEPSRFIRYDEFETILNDDNNPLIFSNININNNFLIRFLETDLETDTSLIALRQNNGKIEFRNKNDINWELLSSGGSGVSNFYNLQDVNITKSNTQTYEYIKFNSSKELINSNLTIIDDNNPYLGGILDTNGFNIKFTSNSGIIDGTGNLALQIETSNSNPNFLNIRKTRNSVNENILDLHADSNNGNNNVNMRISTNGAGDLEIDLNNDTQTNKGDFIIKADEVSFNDITSFSMTTGTFIGSVDFVVLSDGGYSSDSGNPSNINLETETLVLQVNGNDTRYYLYLLDGLNGQKSNLVFETNGSNNKVEIEFLSNNSIIKKVGTGTGLANKFIFNNAGQSAILQYFNFSGYPENSERNRWQVLNTGCSVE